MLLIDQVLICLESLINPTKYHPTDLKILKYQKIKLISLTRISSTYPTFRTLYSSFQETTIDRDIFRDLKCTLPSNITITIIKEEETTTIIKDSTTTKTNKLSKTLLIINQDLLLSNQIKLKMKKKTLRSGLLKEERSFPRKRALKKKLKISLEGKS